MSGIEVGSVVAIIGLASESLRVYQRLDRCIKNLKGARDDVSRGHSETETFSLLLNHFHSTISQSTAIKSTLSADIKSRVIPRILPDGRHAIRKIEHLLHKLRPLRSDKRATAVANATAKYPWLNRSREVFECLTELSCVKSSAAWLTGQISLDLMVAGIGNCSSSQTGESAVSVELVEHLSVLPYLLSRSRCPRSAPNGKHRTFYIKQNQQLQCRCSELEEQCRMARSQATKTNLGAISSGILEITKEVVERHLNENQEIRKLLAQPQGKVGNFIKNNPDMFQKFATRQNAVRKSPNTISESTTVDTLSSDHGANSSSSDDLQGSPLSISAQQRMDISSLGLNPAVPYPNCRRRS